MRKSGQVCVQPTKLTNMTDETKQVDVIMGPYRGNRLTMSAADAQAAVNGHWATTPTDTDHSRDDPHPPLDDAERKAAMDAAHAWAKTTWDAAQGIEQPP